MAWSENPCFERILVVWCWKVSHFFLPDSGCSEVDEIYKICSVIGSPTIESWPNGLKLARDINYQFPQVSFSSFFPYKQSLLLCFYKMFNTKHARCLDNLGIWPELSKNMCGCLTSKCPYSGIGDFGISELGF